MAPVLVGFVVLLLAAGSGALIRGGLVEKRGALMFAAAWIAAMVTVAFDNPVLREAWMFGVELAVLLGLVALSWRSPRPWPIYASGLQLLALAGLVAGWVDPDLDQGFRATFLILLGYAAVAALAIDAWRPRPQDE